MLGTPVLTEKLVLFYKTHGFYFTKCKCSILENAGSLFYKTHNLSSKYPDLLAYRIADKYTNIPLSCQNAY